MYNIMSSWKQYGNRSVGRIGSTESLTVKNLIIKEPYEPNLILLGNLYVKNEVAFDRATVYGNMVIGGRNNALTVNSDVTYNGQIFVNGITVYTSELTTNQNLRIDKNVYVQGNIIYFGNYGNDNGTTIVNLPTGMGINTLTPQAGLDLYTTNPVGLKIKTSKINAQSILLENVERNALSVYTSTDSTSHITTSGIKIYSDISENTVEANISVAQRSLLIDTSYVNVLNQMAISLDKTQLGSNENQTLSVYGMNNRVFYPNIYTPMESNTNNIIHQNSALSLVNDISLNEYGTGGRGLSSMSIKSADKQFSVIGGTYPSNIFKTTGILQLDENNPSVIMVSGSLKTKYFSTTGINTFQPETEKHVLKINGPVSIHNNDISNPTGVYDFEISSICESKMNKGVIVGVGNGRGVNGNITNKYIESFDYGSNWGIPTDITSIVNEGGLNNIKLTSIYMYDTGNIFITGEKNIFIYGNTVDKERKFKKAAGIIIGSDLNNQTYNHVFVHPTPSVSGNLYGYFTLDASSTIVMFEKPKDYPQVLTVNIQTLPFSPRDYNSINGNIRIVNSVKSYNDTMYLCGASGVSIYNSDGINRNWSSAIIMKYKTSVNDGLKLPTLISVNEFTSQLFEYTYNDMGVFDSSFVIAVGRSVISSTGDGGNTWNTTDKAWDPEISIDVNNTPYLDLYLTGIYILDASSAIIVGNNAYSYPDHNLNNIFITNDQGATWSTMQHDLINASGKAKLLASQNTSFKNIIVPDSDNLLIHNTIQPFGNISGGSSTIYNVFTPNYRNRSNNYVLDICGSMCVSGDFKLNEGDFITTKSRLNLFNGTVKKIYFGGDAEIYIGNVYGNTYVQSKMYLNERTYFTNPESSTSATTGALRVSGGAGILGNVYVGGNVITTGGLRVKSTVPSDSTTTGALIVDGGVGVSGTVYASSYQTPSDYRIKTSVQSLHDISYSVDGLKPVKYYNMKTENEDMGFLAHEVQTIYPFLVSGDKDGERLQCLNYSGLTAVLVKEIQDLKEENLKIKRRLSELETSVYLSVD